MGKCITGPPAGEEEEQCATPRGFTRSTVFATGKGALLNEEQGHRVLAHGGSVITRL